MEVNAKPSRIIYTVSNHGMVLLRTELHYIFHLSRIRPLRMMDYVIISEESRRGGSNLQFIQMLSFNKHLKVELLYAYIRP